VLALALAATFSAYREAEARHREAEWQAYVASLAAAESSLLGDQVAEASLHLEAAPPHLRAWEWRHLHARLDRSIETFPAHRMGLTQIEFLPDGARFATSSIDSTIRVWKNATGDLDREYGPFDSAVESMDPVPGRHAIAVGLGSGRVLVVDLETAAAQELHPAGPSWAFLSVNPDGSRLAAGFFDGRVRVWDLATGSVLAEWQAHSGLAMTAYSPDGRYLATGGGEGTVTLHEARAYAKIQDLGKHVARVYSLRFSPDGSRLVTGSMDQTANVWDVERRTLLRTFREHRATVNPIAFEPNGHRVATAGPDGRLLIWNLETGAVQAVLRGHVTDCSALAAHPDGSRIVSGDWGGVVKSWSWGTQDVPTLRATTSWNVPRVHQAARNLDGTVVIGTTNVGILCRWAPGQAEAETMIAPGPDCCIAFAPAESSFVIGSDAGEIGLLPERGGNVERAIQAHRGAILGLAIDADSKILATASADSSVKLWRLPELQLIRSLSGHEGAVVDVEISPTGDLVASTGADGSIRLWDPASDRALAVIMVPEGGIEDIAFDAGGRRLAAVSRHGDVQVWDVAHRRLEASLRNGGGKMLSVAWSRDGTRMAAGGADAIVRLFDVERGREVIGLHGHVSGITSLQFCQDDLFLMSTSQDGTVRTWDSGSNAH
jgi:WD40 repeat protein